MTEPGVTARVWNIRDKERPADAVYIGRAGKREPGAWGNPFSIGKPLSEEGARKIAERLPMIAEIGYAHAGARLTREQSLELYAGYLPWAIRNERLDVRELVEETDEGLQPRHTYCYCVPQPCHGELLMKLADAYCYYRNELEYDHALALETALYILGDWSF